MIGCNVNIPYYGKANLLRETLKSVSQQSIDPELLETAIFDDCSPEGFPGSESSARKSFKLIRNPVNLGMVANWNRCLEYGSRKCVHVLHGDDL